MSDPKTGILFFVPTAKIAGSDPPGAEGSKDLKFFGPTSRNVDGNPSDFAIRNMSDLAAELSDQHLDVGKTMGIRQIIFESFATQIVSQKVTDLGGTYPILPPPLTSMFLPGTPWLLGTVLDSPGGGLINGVPVLSQPNGGVAWQAANAILEAARASAGAAQEQKIERRKRTFTPNQFLLLNLNFKSPIAQTSTAQIKWTFANKPAREANGSFIVKDIGKVALQDDEKSWWVLSALAPVGGGSTLKKPTWKSQDLRSQIVAGCFNNRIVLFFLPDGASDPYYAFINSSKRFATVGNPPRDQKDERHLYDIRGDGDFYGWIEKAKRWGGPLIPDTAFGAGLVTGVPPIEPFGVYPPANWMELIANAVATPTSAGLAPRAGGLGIYNNQTALDAAASLFKKSDIGGSAIVLEEHDFPYGYSPPTTVIVESIKTLQSINPPVFTTTLPGPMQFAQGSFTDTPYECYLFPSNEHADFNVGGFRDVDQRYDTIYNPRVTGTYRLRNEERHSGSYATARFLNTD